MNEDLSMSKAQQRTLTTIWLIIGVAAIAMFAVFLGLMGAPFLSFVITLKDNAPESMAQWVGTTVSWDYNFLDFTLAPGGVSYGKDVVPWVSSTTFYELSSENMLLVAMVLCIVSVSAMAASVISCVPIYVFKKKMAAVPNGLSIMAALFGALGLGYLFLGYTSIVSNVPNYVEGVITFSSIPSLMCVFMALAVVFSLLFAAATPYIIDRRASKAHSGE